MRPDKLQIIGGSESLNTTRTEVAPGSNIVRKNFQGHWLWHINTLENMVGICAPEGAYGNSPIYSNSTATHSSGQYSALLQLASPSLNSHDCR